MRKDSIRKIICSQVFLWLLIVITLVAILSPIIIKIPSIMKIIEWYLKDLGEMKDSYLAIVGGIIGAFLAISGAFWIQKQIDDEKEDEDKIRCLKLVEFDMNRFFAFIRHDYIAHRFWYEPTSYPIKINEQWEDSLLKLQSHIPDKDIQNINDIYDKIYILANHINTAIAYSRMEAMKTRDMYNYSGGGSGEYYEEITTIIKDLFEKIMSKKIIHEVEKDIAKIEEYGRLKDVSKSQLENFRKKYKINGFDTDLEEFFAEKTDLRAEYDVLNKENDDKHKQYEDINKNIRQKWEKKIMEKINYSTDLHDDYEELMNHINQR